MHDPMVVAHDLVLPIPVRSKWRERHYKGRRWGWTRRRRTNAENLGEPIYPWWRPTSWTFALAGRVFVLYKVGTIWHVEPGGRDAFTVCTRDTRWRWHVHHWHLQLFGPQRLRARLFDRCELCGRKGRPNVSHQWDGEPLGWRKWRSRKGLYHHECSSLIHERRTREIDEALIRHLFAALRVADDLEAAELLNRLTHVKGRALEYHQASRLTRVIGYERDDNYELVPKAEPAGGAG